MPFQTLQDCAPVAPARLDGSAIDPEGTTLLASNGAVRFLVCEQGAVRFMTRGSFARGHAAHLVVSWRDQTLWEGEVLEEQTLQVTIPDAGWVALAFVNDFYDPPEDRNLWLSDISFTAGATQ